MQVPPEMVAAPAFVALSTVIGRRVGICPKRFDNWLVIANLWGSTVARPGYFKTPTIAEALKPLGKLIANARSEFQKEKAVKESEMLALEALEATLKDALKKAAKEGQNTEALVKELADVKHKKAKCVAIEKRYKTNDSTIPKLVMLLETRPEGILMVRDELSGFMRNLDRPGCEGDREFFLEAWNGLGSYNVDRVGRESNYVEGLCISLLGGIQPGKLRAYVLESVRGGIGDDGFLQRLQLAVYPDNLGSWKNIDRKPNRDAANRVFEIFQKLDAFDFGGFCSERHLEYEIPIFRFDPAAQDVFDRWREELENKLRSKAIECPAFESHLAKYRSLFPSLALIFHLVTLADGGTDQKQISVDAAVNAANWCDFLEAHARKIYAAAIDITTFAVEALAKKIKKGEVTDGMNVRDIYRHHWSLLDKPEYLEPALIALDKEYGWLRVIPVKPVTGRPSEIVRLNPAIIRGVDK